MGNGKWGVYQDESSQELFVYIGEGMYNLMDDFLGEGGQVYRQGDTEGDLSYVGSYWIAEMENISI